MTTPDIVDQLRSLSYGPGDIPERAAAEITRLKAEVERLRAALEEIVKPGGADDFWQCVAIASAALTNNFNIKENEHG